MRHRQQCQADSAEGRFATANWTGLLTRSSRGQDAVVRRRRTKMGTVMRTGIDGKAIHAIQALKTLKVHPGLGTCTCTCTYSTTDPV
jgi:hypothetical protein